MTWQTHLLGERAVDGHTISACQWGPEDRDLHEDRRLTLVGIHGLEGSGESWGPLFSRLPAQVRGVSLDLPWNGQSGHRWGTSRSTAEWLKLALDLVPRGPLLLLSHSFGATVTLDYLQRHPVPDAAGMVLISPLYYPEASDIDWAMFERSLVQLRGIMREAIDLRIGSRAVPPDVREAMTDKLVQRVGPVGFVQSLLLVAQTPAMRLDTIGIPALVITGDRDLACPSKLAKQLANRLQGADSLTLSDCRHFGMMEHPAMILGSILRFAARWTAGEAPRAWKGTR